MNTDVCTSSASKDELSFRSYDSWSVLKKTSRTFYLSISILPKAPANALCLAYLLLRVSDFFEDSRFIDCDEKIRLLSTWDAILGGAEFPARWRDSIAPSLGREADAIAAWYAEEILAEYRSLPRGLQSVIVTHVRNTTRGMIRWVKRGPHLHDEADLDDYMHEVAGRVGYLATEVFAWHSRSVRRVRSSLMSLARETGLALQTVNVLRGIADDAERGWSYIPEVYFEQEGLSRESFLEPRNRERANRVVVRLIRKAERHLDAAVEYVRIVPRSVHRVRLACIWPMMFAARTVGLLRERPYDATDDVKMTRKDVRKIVRFTAAFGWSNLLVDRYFRSLMSSRSSLSS